MVSPRWNLESLEGVVCSKESRWPIIHISLPRWIEGLGQNHEAGFARFDFEVHTPRRDLRGQYARVRLTGDRHPLPDFRQQKDVATRIKCWIEQRSQRIGAIDKNRHLARADQGHVRLSGFPLEERPEHVRLCLVFRNGTALNRVHLGNTVKVGQVHRNVFVRTKQQAARLEYFPQIERKETVRFRYSIQQVQITGEAQSRGQYRAEWVGEKNLAISFPRFQSEHRPGFSQGWLGF